MIQVVPEGEVTPEISQEIHLILLNEVIPALRRVIGPHVHLPLDVTVSSLLPRGGTVPWEKEFQTGEVLSIGNPLVRFTPNLDVMRYILTHELAHFHELTLRKNLGIRLPGYGIALWSEYYAQRVSWASGYTSMPVLIGEGRYPNQADLPNDQKLLNGEDFPPGYLRAYAFTHTVAHADQDSSWESNYPSGFASWVKAIRATPFADVLFQRFPQWGAEETAIAESYFNLVVKVSTPKV